MPPSCALLGGLAIGARVALLWQHKANAKCYMLVLALCLVCYTVLRSLKFSIIMCPICTHLHTHFTVLLRFIAAPVILLRLSMFFMAAHRPLYFAAVVSIFFLLFSSPILNGRRLDVYHTSHMMWP